MSMRIYIDLFKNLYIRSRFFVLWALVVFFFVVSFFIPILFEISQWLLVIFLLVLLMDVWILFYNRKGITADRKLPNKFSNGDKNTIQLNVTNQYKFEVHLEVIDEIPEQFQIRDFLIKFKLPTNESQKHEYTLKPSFRGLVVFGSLHAYASTPIGLAKRRFSFPLHTEIAVYPSTIQLTKYDLSSLKYKVGKNGLKKIRKLGHTSEFENIKEYVQGDDIRTINWKATAKTQKLKVNQYQDERSQSVYCIIDTGRVMKMPFENLSLLDYAINASLVFSRLVLKKQDNAGIFSFSKRVENKVIADRRGIQMERIMEALYNIKTDHFESDFGNLYVDIRKNISHRSLLLLFTNFETIEDLKHKIHYLKAISKNHVLIVIIFHNTELDTLAHTFTDDTIQIFDKTIAEKFIYEKKLIVQELKKYGIQTILTKPKNLTLDTINKYLEVKARGLI